MKIILDFYQKGELSQIMELINQDLTTSQNNPRLSFKAHLDELVDFGHKFHNFVLIVYPQNKEKIWQSISIDIDNQHKAKQQKKKQEELKIKKQEEELKRKKQEEKLKKSKQEEEEKKNKSVKIKFLKNSSTQTDQISNKPDLKQTSDLDETKNDLINTILQLEEKKNRIKRS